MGWWSTDIIGGDTPMDYEDLFKEIIADNYLTNDDITAEQFENMDEVFANGKIESLDLEKDYRSIAYQVLAVMAMRVGAKISQKLKILMIGNIKQDEWQYENSERRAVIEDLLDTLATYDARHPVKVTSRGLFEVIFNKDQEK